MSGTIVMVRYILPGWWKMKSVTALQVMHDIPQNQSVFFWVFAICYCDVGNVPLLFWEGIDTTRFDLLEHRKTRYQVKCFALVQEIRYCQSIVLWPLLCLVFVGFCTKNFPWEDRSNFNKSIEPLLSEFTNFIKFISVARFWPILRTTWDHNYACGSNCFVFNAQRLTMCMISCIWD